MLGQEENNRSAAASPAARKTYLRSVSWSDHSPRRPNNNPRPHPSNHSKARSSLPPLQPLSITRPPAEEWPRAGSDDLGIWPNPQTPRGGPPLTPQPQSSVREFQFKREKLAFFDKECSRIADHVYLGSDKVAKNREILSQNGITHVLNCVGFVSPEYFKNDLVYKTLWLQDSPSEDITSILYDVFDYFEDVREQGGKVLVHCCQGVSRSTSLVIAYLMWREGQSFEDAFQYVKAARGVTNPNMGFACQLLQCQKRVHAVPASPNSVLRMYRMAPHSSYDALHLVPKMVSQPGNGGLDSRGAFIVHVPSSVFVWIGKNCCDLMSSHAKVAANQVIRYERAQGPFVSVVEGEESKEFWDALGWDKGNGCSSERKVDEYDSDFELFDKAVRGGVVPSCLVSNSGVETCLPAREIGWGKLRLKFTSGVMKEFLSENSKLADDESRPLDSVDCPVADTIMYEGEGGGEQEKERAFAPGSPDSYVSCSPDQVQKFRDKSPTLLSPSASDYSSSSFSFSPSSSNWSDLSYLSSQQPSPSGLEQQQIDPFVTTQKGTTLIASPTKVFPVSPTSGVEKTHVSIAERRGSNPPPLMVLPAIDEPARTNLASASETFSQDDAMNDARELECIREEQMSDVEDATVSSTTLVLYDLHTMSKVDISHLQVLDSRSAYFILACDGSSFRTDDDSTVLYMWLGRQFPDEDEQPVLKSPGSSLDRFGLHPNAPIQIVREGEEPQQLSKLLGDFLSRKWT